MGSGKRSQFRILVVDSQVTSFWERGQIEKNSFLRDDDDSMMIWDNTIDPSIS